MRSRRWLFVALALLSLLAVACEAQEVKTEPESGATTPAKEAEKKSAAVGDGITLEGQDEGSQMKVTVVKVVDPAQPGDAFSKPEGRYVAVQIRLQNTGTAVYSDSPSNGAKLIDKESQQFDTTLFDVKGCPSFSGGSATIRPGDSRLGCLIFDVPKAAKLAAFQFTLDSGFGPDTGEWRIG